MVAPTKSSLCAQFDLKPKTKYNSLLSVFKIMLSIFSDKFARQQNPFSDGALNIKRIHLKLCKKEEKKVCSLLNITLSIPDVTSNKHIPDINCIN